MPEAARNPFLDAVTYFRVTAWALGAIAFLGILLAVTQQSNDIRAQWLSMDGLFLHFTWWHNFVHIALAATAFLFGYAAFEVATVKYAAISLGGVYVVLGILGFFLFNTPDDAFLALTPTLNILHLLLGAWGLAAGLATKVPEPPLPPEDMLAEPKA
jgi:hypothetical protein